MKNLPTFESAFLNEIAKSYSKRRKSLAYDAFNLKFNKVFDVIAGGKTEKIEIAIQAASSANSANLRLYIWADRWIWVDARKSVKNAGWEWEYTTEGRLTGGSSACDAIDAFKEFYVLSAHFSPDTVSKDSFGIWGKLLAKGPVEVPNRP